MADWLHTYIICYIYIHTYVYIHISLLYTYTMTVKLTERNGILEPTDTPLRNLYAGQKQWSGEGHEQQTAPNRKRE